MEECYGEEGDRVGVGECYVGRGEHIILESVNERAIPDVYKCGGDRILHKGQASCWVGSQSKDNIRVG